MYGGFSAVAICEMIFAMVFFGIFMMDLDKQILVVNWVWTVSVLPLIPPANTPACKVAQRFIIFFLLLCRISSVLVLVLSFTSSLL